jgi:hypothetical protein
MRSILEIPIQVVDALRPLENIDEDDDSSLEKQKNFNDLLDSILDFEFELNKLK